MTFNRKMLLAAPFLFATAALAGERVTVNLPFSFENHGTRYPASNYDLQLSDDRTHVVLSRVGAPATRVSLWAKPVEVNRTAPLVSIRFENEGGVHELYSLRLGEYEAQGLRKTDKIR